MDAPETVTEALQALAQRGYTGDLRFDDGIIRCPTCGRAHPPADVVVREVFRFEGPSDPADEAIVLGIECLHCGARGALVSAFGPDADDQLLRLQELLERQGG